MPPTDVSMSWERYARELEQQLAQARALLEEAAVNSRAAKGRPAINTEKYCRACNEKDGHAEGCEIVELEQQLAKEEQEYTLRVENGRARELLKEIKHILDHDVDWDSVTDWRDACITFLAEHPAP